MDLVTDCLESEFGLKLFLKYSLGLRFESMGIRDSGFWLQGRKHDWRLSGFRVWRGL